MGFWQGDLAEAADLAELHERFKNKVLVVNAHRRRSLLRQHGRTLRTLLKGLYCTVELTDNSTFVLGYATI